MPRDISATIKNIDKMLNQFNRLDIENASSLASTIRWEEKSSPNVITIIGDAAYKLAERVADEIDGNRYRLRDSQKPRILEDCMLVMLYAELCGEGAKNGWYTKVPMFDPTPIRG